jgi:hypothetical protein
VSYLRHLLVLPSTLRHLNAPRRRPLTHVVLSLTSSSHSRRPLLYGCRLFTSSSSACHPHQLVFLISLSSSSACLPHQLVFLISLSSSSACLPHQLVFLISFVVLSRPLCRPLSSSTYAQRAVFPFPYVCGTTLLLLVYLSSLPTSGLLTPMLTLPVKHRFSSHIMQRCFLPTCRSPGIYRKQVNPPYYTREFACHNFSKTGKGRDQPDPR